jgi:hypothetical protein
MDEWREDNYLRLELGLSDYEIELYKMGPQPPLDFIR